MFPRTTAIAAVLAALAPFSAFSADRRLSYDALASASDKVLVGSVGVRASHWADDAHIYTEVMIYPDVTIKGTDQGPVLVQMLGGTVGDTTMSVSDGPQLNEGQRVVLFLKQESGRFVVVGRAAGTVNAASPEAADAVESAAANTERATGRLLTHERGLARLVLGRASSPAGRATAHAATQVGCYSTDGAKWGAASATYKIGAGIPVSWNASIDAASFTWNNVGAGFRLVNDSSSVNELSYKDLVAAYGSSYANTFAVTTTWSSTSTGQISKATIEINSSWPWNVTGDASGPDVQNIVTHEFGHWMRLLDIYSPSTCSEVTMWGSAAYGETKKRTLEQPDIDGFLSLYSAGGSTTVGVPALLSPANGATGVAATSALSWTAASNAASYDVYLGTSASPGLVATLTGTTYQPGALTAGATYYWRVVAKNTSTSSSSPTYSFTVSAGTGGTASGPTLLSPGNGATGVSLTPLMQWTAVSGATAYDIYIGTTTSPARIGTVGGTAVYVSGFRSGTLYYWKVVARTGTGSASSAVASFTTN